MISHKTESRVERGLLMTGILLLGVCVYLLSTLDQRVRATEKIKDKDYSEDYARFAELMAEIFYQIEEKYVEEVDPSEIFDAALEGMFYALDPYSSYLGSENFKELEKSTEGEFSGIGIHINKSNGVLTVVSPIPGTPAARVGLQAWDRIVEIEGETTEGISTADAVKLLTGPVGTEVNILVYRESERKRIPFTITRDRIKIESVYSNADEEEYVTDYYKFLLENKIGFIRLTKFSDNVGSEMEAVLRKMEEQGVKGLILDVRFNSGGLLTEGIDVSDLFLEKGQAIVGTKGRLKEQNQIFRAKKKAVIDWPIVALTNEGSASATEILVGALQDHHRAVLIGPEVEGKKHNTFGKALVQTISPLRVSLDRDEKGNELPNALRLTTARYYTPNNIGEDGESMHGVGIEPDMFVKIPKEQPVELLTKGMLLGDPALVQEKEEEQEKEKEGEEEGEEELPFYLENKDENQDPTTEDLQLRYGVDILKALLISNHE